jgi:hypothetical protein
MTETALQFYGKKYEWWQGTGTVMYSSMGKNMNADKAQRQLYSSMGKIWELTRHRDSYMGINMSADKAQRQLYGNKYECWQGTETVK